jgi:hypothetical protein
MPVTLWLVIDSVFLTVMLTISSIDHTWSVEMRLPDFKLTPITFRVL